MTSLRNMIIGAVALAAGGAAATPAPAANAGADPQARLIAGVYNPAEPVSLTKAEWPLGCYFANGWHGPGYYSCGYSPEGYYSYRPEGYYRYQPEGYYSYRPAHYSYRYHRRYRARHYVWRREHRRWRA
jgi:hypothetical protein